jgi:DNA-binding CsgD family transcriptional regulator
MVSFWRACTPVLASAIPHYMSPCCYTLDPASRLITSHFQEGMPEFPPEWVAQEYAGDDVNQLVDVARSSRGLSTLHDATKGDPSSSPRWQANMAYGGDQELIVALRSRSGETWGALGLYREPDRPLFDPAEQAFLVRISSLLADAVRRSLLVGESADPERSDSPGMVIFDADWQPESLSPSAERWLRDLPGGDGTPFRLPPVVAAVAGRAARADADPHDSVAVARVRTLSGRWVVLHGMQLGAPPDSRVAVIIEPAHPSVIAPLLMSAYSLTEREQQLTRLVLHGYSTTEIAGRLVISANTVQEHLKKVFTKTGVRSRRELVTTIFFDHYEPRVRDNEHRATLNRPLRGGPAPTKN